MQTVLPPSTFTTRTQKITVGFAVHLQRIISYAHAAVQLLLITPASQAALYFNMQRTLPEGLRQVAAKKDLWLQLGPVAICRMQ